MKSKAGCGCLVSKQTPQSSRSTGRCGVPLAAVHVASIPATAKHNIHSRRGPHAMRVPTLFRGAQHLTGIICQTQNYTNIPPSGHSTCLPNATLQESKLFAGNLKFFLQKRNKPPNLRCWRFLQQNNEGPSLIMKAQSVGDMELCFPISGGSE